MVLLSSTLALANQQAKRHPLTADSKHILVLYSFNKDQPPQPPLPAPSAPANDTADLPKNQYMYNTPNYIWFFKQ